MTDDTPYTIVDAHTQDFLGTSLVDGQGVYLHNVNFKVIDGQAIVEGRFKGHLDRNRVNISKGEGVAFYKEDNVFKVGNDFTPIRTARMVQVFNGIIKVVIK